MLISIWGWSPPLFNKYSRFWIFSALELCFALLISTLYQSYIYHGLWPRYLEMIKSNNNSFRNFSEKRSLPSVNFFISNEESKESLFPLTVSYRHLYHGNTDMVFKSLSLAVSLNFCIIEKYISIYLLLFYSLSCLWCQLNWTLETALNHGKISVQKSRSHEVKSNISST